MFTITAELEDLVDSTVNIPTIPAVLMEITRVVNSPDGSAKEAGAIIERDAAIAARVLRLVNSSFYGLRNPVSSINLACSIVGLKVIKNLVVQATVLKTFTGGAKVPGFDPEWLWDHSFKTAVACRLLAEQSPAASALPKDDAYTCGLIHDIGKLILVDAQTERFAEALQHSAAGKVPLAKAEGEVFGFNHAHVGGLLAQRWKLPEKVQAAVTYHHSPATNAVNWTRGFVVKAANTIAHRAAVAAGRPSRYLADLTDDDSLLALGLPDGAIAALVAKVQTVGSEM